MISACTLQNSLSFLFYLRFVKFSTSITGVKFCMKQDRSVLKKESSVFLIIIMKIQAHELNNDYCAFQ